MATSNSDQKRRGMQHYLHRQWIATKGGQEQHKADCAKMREKKVKATKGKGKH